MRPLAALLLLAACSTGLPAAAPRANVSFVGDAGGLAVPETGQRVDFGRSPRGVIPVLDRELGAGRPLALDRCPAGVVKQMQWGDLVLSFTDERLVGWRSSAGAAGQTCG